MKKFLIISMLIGLLGCVVKVSGSDRSLVGRSRPQPPGWMRADVPDGENSDKSPSLIYSVLSKSDLALALRQAESQALQQGKQVLLGWMDEQVASIVTENQSKEIDGILTKAKVEVLETPMAGVQIRDIYFEEYRLDGEPIKVQEFDVFVLLEVKDVAKRKALSILAKRLKKSKSKDARALAVQIVKKRAQFLAH